jgi:hypothetical protein
MLKSNQNRSELFRDITETCDITNVMKPIDRKLDQLENSKFANLIVGLTMTILASMIVVSLIAGS